MKKSSFIGFLIILTLLAACLPKPVPVPVPTATNFPSVNHILISEVMAGKQGNNNYDFIELFNPTTELVNLQGYSLFYKLNQSTDQVLIHQWNQPAFIPPNGNYLIARSGQNIASNPDLFFDYSLVPQRGSLSLSDANGNPIDQLAWGETDSPFVEKSPAPAFQNDHSLERFPGSPDGNGQDQDNNASDFKVNNKPNPQSSSNLTSKAQSPLIMSVAAPDQVKPGSEVIVQIQVTNNGREEIAAVKLSFPPMTDAEFKSSTIPATQTTDFITIDLGNLPPGMKTNLEVTFQSSWKYTTLTHPGFILQSSDQAQILFSGVLRTQAMGGSVPIAIARTLIENQGVMVEGIATMYTGGFFAGSSGLKFYLEDDTGGVQIYIPNGKGKLDVPLGATVQVSGVPTLYRGATELIAQANEIRVIRPPVEAFARQPLAISIPDLKSDPDNLTGRLLSIQGEITRAHEFSYSYEIDLEENNQTMTIYVDKLTGIVVETISVGEYFQVTGILEVIDDKLQLYPRVQQDLKKIQPPQVVLEANLPVNYQAGQDIPLDLQVINHLSHEINNLVLTLILPTGVQISQLPEPCHQNIDHIICQSASLAGNASEVTFPITIKPASTLPYVHISEYSLTYQEQENPLEGAQVYSFLGETIPIWAIQGDADKSPYILQSLTTNGIVTAVFPSLGGFYIQGEDDGNPQTSQGLFVSSQYLDGEIHPGDLISVSGIIHESGMETQLLLIDWELEAKNQPIPKPVTLNPPQDERESIQYYEALEGMLVTTNGKVRAVSPTNRYGEITVVALEYEDTHLFQGQQNGQAIRIDDGLSLAFEDQSQMVFSAATGDILSNITGPLSFTYGQYKIQPVNPPLIEKQPLVIDALPKTGQDQYRVMTWNVENLFDPFTPHPSSPRLPTVAEYKVWLDKIAATILLADYPAIIALQEVEHIGVLEDIAGHSQLASQGYQPVLVEGSDSRGIDVGFLVRKDVQINSFEAFPAPEELTPRPPLLLEAQLQLGSSKRTIFVLNNHFLSMSAGELATEPRRIAQAAWNLEILKQIRQENPHAMVLILGDLNSYYNSPPIDILREGGFFHTMDLLSPDERYTYIYQGIAQVLDHILVSNDYQNLIASVDILHVNADYPIQMPDDRSAIHKSDHDPVVVTFH